MTSIEALQRAIDALDDEIIERLALRFTHARAIGAAKLALGSPPYDLGRMRDQNERFVEGCVRRGLDPAMARQLMAVIGAQVLAERLESFRSAAGAVP